MKVKLLFMQWTKNVCYDGGNCKKRYSLSVAFLAWIPGGGGGGAKLKI